MAQRTERDVLNHLIDTCMDGARGFRTAAEHVRSESAQALFLEIAAQREAFTEALRPHAQRLGGANDADGTVAGALHRGWMTLRDSVGTHSDATVIQEAERGEQSALAAYDDALASVLAPLTRDEVERQRGLIALSCGRVQRCTPA